MMDLIVQYLFLATILGAAQKIYTVIKLNKYKESFLVLGGGGGGLKGGSGDYSPPAAPDPAATARAQSAADRQTARTNALLLNPNVVGPYGNISYDSNSANIDGDTINRPTQTTTLSPAQQRQLDLRNQISDYLGQAGVGLARNMPSTPMGANPNYPQRPTSIDYSGVDRTPTLEDFNSQRDNAEKSVYDRGMRLMQPDLDLQRKGLQEQLAQTGNPLGSEAYNNEMNRYQRSYDENLQNLADKSVLAGSDEQNRLFNNAMQLKAQQLADAQRPYQTAQQIRGDQLNEDQSLRTQQINELAALLQGGQAIQTPSGAQYNQAALKSPDITGMTQQNYQSQLAGYNAGYQANQQAGSAFNSGLFGIGAALARPAAGYYFGGAPGARASGFGF